ncbi:MAG: exopolyphosphatase, partial [bacterium]
SGRLQAAVVVDIGGGSTELVLGREGRVRASVSLDVGSVRLTERHLIDDPPGEAQIADVEHDVTTALARAQIVTADAAGATVIGVAGTITTLAGMTLGLDHYDSDRIDGAVLPVSAVEATIARLVRMPRAERVAIGVLHPGRIDVIAAGAIILRTVLRRLDAAELTVSEHDILDGIAATLARP